MATKVPAFTFEGGTCDTAVKNGYWYIYLKSGKGAKLTFSYNKNIELFLVGSGGAGGSGHSRAGGGGGGGGACAMFKNISVAAGNAYAITVGEESSGAGKASSAFGYSAAGGSKGDDATWHSAGAGGAGGAKTSGAYLSYAGGKGGKGGNYAEDEEYDDLFENGANGTMREFGSSDTSLPLYGPGGGGASWHTIGGTGGKTGGGQGAETATAGTANTGGGGGGGQGEGDDHNGAKGGSGIVIIRGAEDDLLPVWFNGTRLTEMFFNGEKVNGMVYGGTRIFARRCVEWLSKRWACRFGFRRATPVM